MPATFARALSLEMGIAAIEAGISCTGSTPPPCSRPVHGHHLCGVREHGAGAHAGGGARRVPARARRRPLPANHLPGKPLHTSSPCLPLYGRSCRLGRLSLLANCGSSRLGPLTIPRCWASAGNLRQCIGRVPTHPPTFTCPGLPCPTHPPAAVQGVRGTADSQLRQHPRLPARLLPRPPARLLGPLLARLPGHHLRVHRQGGGRGAGAGQGGGGGWVGGWGEVGVAGRVFGQSGRPLQLGPGAPGAAWSAWGGPAPWPADEAWLASTDHNCQMCSPVQAVRWMCGWT